MGRSHLERELLTCAAVVGRITEKHLSEAERSFPGIGAMYRGMEDKPATFLQLVWIYEAEAAASESIPSLVDAAAAVG